MSDSGVAVKRGLFIVLEGPDGAGISTQTAHLNSALGERGMRSIATKEPTAGPIGSILRQILSHRLVLPTGKGLNEDVVAMLFAADRLDHIYADILPRLEAGTHVICDRYRLSSYAYQGATLGQDWVRALNARSIAPDVTFFIDVPPEVSQQRISSRGNYVELYETDEKLRPIYDNYLRLIQEARQAGERIIVVDGKGSVIEVGQAILTKLLELV
ncbi:MAG: dTMP kinase [Chloroflexia bacterium]